MITRDNYEEWFLLYLDNELSQADRQRVDGFVKDNPDLREELSALLECRLVPDSDLSFGNPVALLKISANDPQQQPQTDPLTGPTNPAVQRSGPFTREDMLLSFIDGELDEDTHQAMEALARSNPELLRELTLLQQTVSEPDPAIVFPNKDMLYKKEKRRVIGIFPFTRVAAAAAVLLLLAGLGIWIRTPIKKESPAVTSAAPHALYPSTMEGQEISRGTAKTIDTIVDKQPKIARRTDRVQIGRQRELKHSMEPGTNGQRNNRQDDPAISVSAPTGADPQEQEQKIARSLVNIPPAGLINQKNDAAARITRIDPPSVRNPGDKAAPEPAPTSSFATLALEHDPPDAVDPELFPGPPAREKNKLRGVFRRLSRTFEKSANRDGDDKQNILIGNVQIALK